MFIYIRYSCAQRSSHFSEPSWRSVILIEGNWRTVIGTKILAENFWIASGVLLIATGLVMWPIFLAAPVGHDAFLPELWATRVAETIVTGNLYPRWLDDVNGGGSPVLFFYGIVFFWISSIFIIIFGDFVSVNLCLMISVGFISWASGIVIRAVLIQYVEIRIALLFSILYLILPYRYAIDFWYRSAFAESMAYFWFPFCILQILKLKNNALAGVWLSVGFAGFIMSHLPTALLGGSAIGLFLLVQCGKQADFFALAKAVVALALGVGISALYLIPALYLQESIHAEIWWQEGFRASDWLIGSMEAPKDARLPLMLPLIFMVWSLVGIISIMLLRQQNSIAMAGSWIGMTAFSAFMMTAPSSVLWENLPLLFKVQFPWRMFVIYEVSCLVMFAISVNSIKRFRKSEVIMAVIGGTAMIAGGAVITFLATGPYFPVSSNNDKLIGYHQTVEDFVSQGRGAKEYLPREVQVKPVDVIFFIRNELRRSAVFEGSQFFPVGQTGMKMSINLEVDQPGTLIVPRFSFPIWIVRVNGREIQSTPSVSYGLISVQLTPGHHLVEIARTWVWQERLGAVISIISLVALLYCQYWWRSRAVESSTRRI